MKPNLCAHVAEYWTSIYQFCYWRKTKEHILDFCYNRIEYYLTISTSSNGYYSHEI